MAELDGYLAEQAEYIETAIRHAAIALQWQASDATEDGNGYPIGDNLNPDGDEYTDAIIAKVPYLTEAVTAFVELAWQTLGEANVTAEQCGHDFILTANHHGAGFWDRGLGWRGDALTEATRGYSFDAEFALDSDWDVAYLMVENTVIVNNGALDSEGNWTLEDA